MAYQRVAGCTYRVVVFSGNWSGIDVRFFRSQDTKRRPLNNHRMPGSWVHSHWSGQAAEKFKQQEKASMYLLNRKAMIPFLESTDWCVYKFSSKQRRVREVRKDLMQKLSTACHAGCSLGCYRLLEGFSILVNHAKWNTLLSMLKVSTQGILTDIVHGSQSGVTSPYLMRRDFFHLRIIARKQLMAAILLLLVICGLSHFSHA